MKRFEVSALEGCALPQSLARPPYPGRRPPAQRRFWVCIGRRFRGRFCSWLRFGSVFVGQRVGFHATRLEAEVGMLGLPAKCL